jgi:hypothetical protein
MWRRFVRANRIETSLPLSGSRTETGSLSMMHRSLIARDATRTVTALLLTLCWVSLPALAVEDGVERPAAAPVVMAEIKPSMPVAVVPTADVPSVAKQARFEQERASQDTRQIADQVVETNDNRGLPFAIVDKKGARVYVFDAAGVLRGAAPALLGLAIGDDTVPGIGDRKLSSIRPDERTTPAGRFVVALDRNLHGAEILWVDYDAGISLHRVVPGTAAEHRAQRLASASTLDNRISFGCINVPAKFFDSVVLPAFSGTDGVVYILPETRPVQTVFAPQRSGATASASR